MEGRKEGVPCYTHTYISDNDVVIIRAKKTQDVLVALHNNYYFMTLTPFLVFY